MNMKKRGLPFKSNLLEHNLKINQEELKAKGHIHLISRKLIALQQSQGELRVLMSAWKHMDLDKQGTRQGAGQKFIQRMNQGAGTGWLNQSSVFLPFLVASLIFEQSSFSRKF